MNSAATEYVEAIVRRARVPMEPANFEPDWADQPRRYKTYDAVPEFPLPAAVDAEPGPLSSGLTQPLGDRGTPVLDLESLAALLRQSFGLGSRRLRVNGNTKVGNPPWYQNATWSRGTASGGGLYPLEIYWVCGRSGPLLPGVYYYASVRHTLCRLLAGDATDQVRAALPPDARNPDTDQFLLVTVKFWKNAFKYNSFCYHVVTMDLGALLGTWRLWSGAAGLPGRPALWFAEQRLNRLLNLDTFAESTMAVVPLPPGPVTPADAGQGGVRGPDEPAVRVAERERSSKVLRFEQIEKVHGATLEGHTPPGTGALNSARALIPATERTSGRLTLPRPAPGVLGIGLGTALRTRRSSFGTFSGHPPVTGADLSTLLAATGGGNRLDCDARDGDTAPLTRIAVFANHVDGVPAGAYDYQPTTGELIEIPGSPAGQFLQRHYFLDNYNLEQAAAVVAVIARPTAVIAAAGDRGYRLVNAEVGAVAQTLYLVAAAVRLGCGAVLGFDNVAVAERLGLNGTDQWPLLLIMVGAERAGAADIDFRLA